MAPSFKFASIILLFKIPSLVIATSPNCSLKDPAPRGSTCGAYGTITKYNHFIDDLYDAQYTNILSCASECAKRKNCKSFNVRTGQDGFCELNSGTQKQVGFVTESLLSGTGASYQGFDLACFNIVKGATSDGPASTGAGTSSDIQASSQVTTSQDSRSATNSSSAIGSQAFIAQSTPSSSTTLTSLSTTSASPTTTPYVCHEDNCYRALLRFGDQAKGFCSDYTAVTNDETATVPAYLDNCFGNPAMISSGCSCLATWISPNPPQTPSSSPSSLTSIYASESSAATWPPSPIQETTSTDTASSWSSSTDPVVSSLVENIGTSQSSMITSPTTIISFHYFFESKRSNSTSTPTLVSTSRTSSKDPTVLSAPSTITLYPDNLVPATTTGSVTKYMITTVYATSVSTVKECTSDMELCYIGLPMDDVKQETRAVALPVEAKPSRPTLVSPSMVTITSTGETSTKTMTYPIDQLPPPPCGLGLDAFDHKEKAYWAQCSDYTPTTTPKAKAAKRSLPTVTITSTDKASTKTITYPIDQLPSPPCGLGLNAFDNKEEAYWAQCPNAISTTTPTPKPIQASPNPSMVTITTSDKSSSKFMTYQIVDLPPPPCGLNLDAFDHKEEAYWPECPNSTSSSQSPSTSTPSSTSNAAFLYPSEALWTYPATPRGSPWTLLSPGTAVPTGLEIETMGPEWSTLPSAATKSPDREKDVEKEERKPLSVALSAEKLSMTQKEDEQESEKKNKTTSAYMSAGLGLGRAGRLSVALAIVGGAIVVLL